MLILNDLSPLPWWLSALGIAAVSLLLLWTTGRVFGLSTGLDSLCALTGSKLPYFRRPDLGKAGSWRLWLFLGLLLGGFLSALLSGGWAPFWDMGSVWDASAALTLGSSPLVKVIWMFVGGTLVGLGTRIGRGCTSGHGITGLALFQPASLAGVLSFMGAAILVANLLYRVLLAAG